MSNDIRPMKPVEPEDFKDAVLCGVTVAPVMNSKGDVLYYERRPVAIRPGAGTLLQHGNILVLGPAGSGKGRLIKVNTKNYRHSMVIVDLKGETYTDTAEDRKRFGAVYVVDVRNATGHRINPLAIIEQDQRFEFADVLVSLTNDDTFWKSVAIDMWLACWAAADHAGRPHIPYAVEIMGLGVADAMKYFLSHHRDDPATMRHLVDFFGRQPTDEWAEKMATDSPSKLLESMWRTVITTKTIFNNENMLRVLNGHDIDVSGMFYDDGIATLYIMADERKKVIFRAFAQLVVRAVGDALITEGDREGYKRRPVLMMFDEFGTVKLNAVMDWLNTMRSRDVVLMLFVQKVSQLNTSDAGNYDINDENSIHHWIVFKPSRPNNSAGQLISALSGQTTVSVPGSHSTTTSPDGTVSHSQGYSYRERAMIEQEDYERWSNSGAYCVLTQAETEKYTIQGASHAAMGWQMPPKAAPLPDLPAYVSPLLAVPSELPADLASDLPSTENPKKREEAELNTVSEMFVRLTKGGGF